MNYLYLPELAVESSEHICSDGDPSDMSSGTTTASACLPQGSRTDSSHPPRSLATCVSSWSPVPLANTEDLRTWLAQAFPASRTALQERDLEPMTSATCGPRPPLSFAKFDPQACCWRTSQASLLGMQHESSPTWPEWAMWDEQAAYPLPIPELCTSENVGGVWPTPQAQMPGAGPNSTKVKNLLTGSRHSFYLTQAVEAERQMPGVITRWRTPNASDGRKWNAMTVEERVAKGQQVRLGNQVGAAGLLNPAWVEWLMGFPNGWTDCAPLGMPKFREWLKQHGSY